MGLIRRNAVPHHPGERPALEAPSGGKAKATEQGPRLPAARQDLVAETGRRPHRSENVDAYNGLRRSGRGKSLRFRRIEGSARRLRQQSWCDLLS
jgi:hypothetical protein